MANLDDIPKEEFFRTPDGYFERLPEKVQARVTAAAEERPVLRLRFAMRYALPLLIVLGIVYFFMPASSDVDQILATVETQEMIDYLQESVMTTDDVLETLDWSSDDLESIEEEIYDAAFQATDSVDVDL